MGENIADLGGLTLALNAYHASLKGKPAPIVHGLTVTNVFSSVGRRSGGKIAG